MKVIPREGRRITYSTEIRNLKKRLTLNDTQRSIVIGTILGDGTLAESWSKSNYRLKIHHSAKQEAYVRWKYDMLCDWFLSEPRYYERTHSISARTVSHRELTALRMIFYRGKKKIIPKHIDAIINPLVLAVWFMDDGNVRTEYGRIQGYHLNTQSFSEMENKNIANALKKHWGIHAFLQKNHKKYRLYIGAKSRTQFRALLQPILIPSMQYKLG